MPGAKQWSVVLMGACGLWQSTPGFAEEDAAVSDVVEAIEALTERPGMARWDVGVRSALVSRYDSNRSRSLDRVAEVEAVPCAAWEALDAAVRTVGRRPVRAVYGFAPGLPYAGEAFGIVASLRPAADARLVACGLGADLGDPGVVQDQGVGDNSSDPMARAVGALPNAGSAAWFATARGVLLSRYDPDRSGAVDTSADVARISCALWSVLDAGVRAGGDGTPLRTQLGLDAGLTFSGERLGLAETVRAEVNRAAAGCNLQGQTNWVGLLRQDVVGSYDMDGSGLLDKGKELKAVRCVTWLSLDAAIRARHGGLGLRAAYSFAKDVPAPRGTPEDLGVAAKKAKLADKHAARCGVARD